MLDDQKDALNLGLVYLDVVLSYWQNDFFNTLQNSNQPGFFAELIRFGKAYGARIETMHGLSGFGDLVLTCGTPQSRNFSFGMALGRGERVDTASHGKLAEGFFTAPVLIEMARAKDVEMPITAAVAAILDGRISVDAAIEGLLTRPLKAEE